jgi:hypothetical protein
MRHPGQARASSAARNVAAAFIARSCLIGTSGPGDLCTVRLGWGRCVLMMPGGPMDRDGAGEHVVWLPGGLVLVRDDFRARV